MTIQIQLLGREDGATLERLAPDVFDGAVDPALVAEFLADPRHHLVVAVDGGLVVGMASALHYIHPDKPPQLWINEVGVASTHRGQGIGRQLMDRLLAHGRSLHCSEAWVLTDRANGVACRLYEGAGATIGEECLMYTFMFDPP